MGRVLRTCLEFESVGKSHCHKCAVLSFLVAGEFNCFVRISGVFASYFGCLLNDAKVDCKVKWGIYVQEPINRPSSTVDYITSLSSTLIFCEEGEEIRLVNLFLNLLFSQGIYNLLFSSGFYPT